MAIFWRWLYELNGNIKDFNCEEGRNDPSHRFLFSVIRQNHQLPFLESYATVSISFVPEWVFLIVGIVLGTISFVNGITPI